MPLNIPPVLCVLSVLSIPDTTVLISVLFQLPPCPTRRVHGMSYAWCQYIQYILETQKTGGFQSGLCVQVVGQEAERQHPVPRVGVTLVVSSACAQPLRKWSYWKGWLGHLENCDNKPSNYRPLFKCPQESSGTFITFFHSIHSWKTL